MKCKCKTFDWKYLKTPAGLCDTWQALFGMWTLVELYRAGGAEDDNHLTEWSVIIGILMAVSAMIAFVKCFTTTSKIGAIFDVFYVAGAFCSILSGLIIFFTTETNDDVHQHQAALCFSVCMGVFYIYGAFLSITEDWCGSADDEEDDFDTLTVFDPRPSRTIGEDESAKETNILDKIPEDIPT